MKMTNCGKKRVKRTGLNKHLFRVPTFVNFTKSVKVCMNCRFGTMKIFAEKQDGKKRIKNGNLSTETGIFP